jgi:hypothetical protein
LTKSRPLPFAPTQARSRWSATRSDVSIRNEQPHDAVGRRDTVRVTKHRAPDAQCRRYRSVIRDLPVCRLINCAIDDRVTANLAVTALAARPRLAERPGLFVASPPWTAPTPDDSWHATLK